MKENQKGFGIVVILIMIMLVLLFGVGWYVYSRYKSTHVSYQEVSSHPEATLIYPGSKIVGKRGSSQEPIETFGNKNPAHAGIDAVTSETTQQIYDFYHQWMIAHGWTPYDIGRTSGQLSTQGYQRGTRESFGVAIDDPTWHKTIASKYPGKTFYETLYILSPP